MAMPFSGTFDYVVTVPHDLDAGAFECRAALGEPVLQTGDELHDYRLVGTAPWLRVADAGLTPDPGPHRPRVLRSRVTLTAKRRRDATVREVSFHVDKGLISCLRGGDSFHLVRTGCGGLGVSVIREQELVVAAGAVTEVVLGRGVRARIPWDPVEAAEAIFRQRDPDFEVQTAPIEVSVNDLHAVLEGGERTLGPYVVFVVHGFIRGIPGTDPCAAICRKGGCPIQAASASAMLLGDEDALSMSRW